MHASVTTVLISVIPEAWISPVILLIIALRIPPCPSTRPIAAGVSRGAWWTETPGAVRYSWNMPRLWRPLSHTTWVGYPAQLNQRFRSISKHRAAEAWPVPARITSHSWKHVNHIERHVLIAYSIRNLNQVYTQGVMEAVPLWH